MRKKILFATLIFIILISAGIIYLNNVFLPIKIKSFIIQRLQEKTQKKVIIDSVKFSIFKGLILKNFVIYDEERTIFSLKEGSCTFLIIPIFKKTIFIPSVRLQSPILFLQRREDNTFNIQDFFPKTPTKAEEPKFSVSFYRVTVKNAAIKFQDDTIAGPFIKNIENLDLNLYLSLPAGIRFNLKSIIPANPAINIDATGEFKIPNQELTAKISLRNLAPSEFSGYYRDWGVSFPEGLLDILIDAKFQNNILSANLGAQIKNLGITQKEISAKLNSEIKSDLQYNFKEKKIDFSGKTTISNSQISGLEVIDAINNINAEATFNNAGVVLDKVNANIWGLPILAQIRLDDFRKPMVNAAITSGLKLSALQNILKDKLQFNLPGVIEGDGNLSLNIETKIPLRRDFKASGYLDISNGILKLEKIGFPFDNINGRLEFSEGQVKWSELNFKCLDVPYRTKGNLTNFLSPAVQIELLSEDLSAQSLFSINQNLISLSQLVGRYLNSTFSLAGEINLGEPSNLMVNLNGELNIDTQDLKEPLKKFKDQLERIKPIGVVNAQFNLAGNLNDFKTCAVRGQLLSSNLSIYGLNAQNFSLSYAQAEGLIDIPQAQLSLYGGIAKASAKMNLNSENLPYWINAEIKGVRIEELKQDTAIKDKDVSGIIQAETKINGFSADLTKLNGVGKILVSEGKLWELNIFKGLGALLFSEDFANIIFHEGSCDFCIQDKYIFTDNLKLKSNVTDLSGSVKIGFDSSLDASLNVEILSEITPLGEIFKDVSKVLTGKEKGLGLIKISGTLKDPKYKFQPITATDLIKGLKDTIFGE